MTAARTYRVFPTTESDFDLLTTAVGGDRRAAWALLNKYGSPAAIASSSPDELAKVSGLGPDRAAVLKAGLELGRRAALARPQERPRITKPDDAAALLMSRMRPERLKQAAGDRLSGSPHPHLLPMGQPSGAGGRIL
ncbi:MAG TPA: hypothetical protein EYP77_03080, partial [Anaerolineae bacterium]|nr:hypothetical protein [Anaerolineae bacterium]